MSVLFLLVIASVCVAGIFLAAFIWTVKSDQLNDYKGASMRMLYDDTETGAVSNSLNNHIDE